jgi:hypothetical protein
MTGTVSGAGSSQNEGNTAIKTIGNGDEISNKFELEPGLARVVSVVIVLVRTGLPMKIRSSLSPGRMLIWISRYIIERKVPSCSLERWQAP